MSPKGPGQGQADARSRLTADLALSALRLDKDEDAEKSLRRQLLARPGDITLLANLGNLLVGQRRDEEAIIAYDRALEMAPGADRIRLSLALALRRQKRLDAALGQLERLSEPTRSSFDARAAKAAILGQIGLHDREIAAYEELLASFPKSENAWLNYGNALKTLGRTDAAIRALRRAIRIRPTFGNAYWSLANLKTYRFEPREIAAMRRAVKSRPADSDLLHLHFALGKALEDRGEFETSFEHYSTGNRIRRSAVHPSQMDLRPRVDAVIQTFTAEFLAARAEAGCPDPSPIFIVGLQRSGSTLVEQILAAHPMIESVTELTVVDQLWDLVRSADKSAGDPFSAIQKMDAGSLRELGVEYLRRTKLLRIGDRPHFIDKQAGNWAHLGFIHLILPEAKIIDTRRHPMACGFSNFRQHYDTGVLFSYSLETIGRVYADYLRLMNHFDKALRGAVHHVFNERLIEDPEFEIRSLLDHVGVPFDPACLHFHASGRAVHSASSEQVRRPINRDGVDYWKNYEPWLRPLKEALGDALDSWEQTGA